MEALWDPGSQALLDELGIGQGWKCLELGAEDMRVFTPMMMAGIGRRA